MVLPLLAVLTTAHLEADVDAQGGDYVVVPFEVPAGTVEIQIAHTDGSDAVILDWGVWGPGGFRGWGGGLTDDAIIGVDESSRGYREGPITPGTWQLVIGKAKLAAGAGHYVVDVTCRDDATLTPLPRAAFDPVVVSTGPRWYAGDFHVHSEESGDASATLEMIHAYARGRGLDFAAITDHNTDSQHPRIAALQATTDDFLFLRGIEITTYAGHGNAIGVAEYVDHRVGLGGVTAATITADVQRQGGVFLVNHPALALGDACIGCAWEHADTPWNEVNGLEIITGNFELTSNFVPQVLALWEAHAGGNYLAAVGGGDDHRAGTDTGPAPGRIGSPTTMVFAPELSEAAIVEAVRRGRTVVKLRGPDDPMVELAIVRADGSEVPIGDSAGPLVGATVLVRAHVTGGAGDELKIYADGEDRASAIVEGDDWRGDIAVPIDTTTVRFRGELEENGLRVVVTSHIYANAFPGDDAGGGGCGCASRDPRGGVPLALALLALVRPRRRRSVRRARGSGSVLPAVRRLGSSSPRAQSSSRRSRARR
jgi:hypothetical protein